MDGDAARSGASFDPDPDPGPGPDAEVITTNTYSLAGSTTRRLQHKRLRLGSVLGWMAKRLREKGKYKMEVGRKQGRWWESMTTSSSEWQACDDISWSCGSWHDHVRAATTSNDYSEGSWWDGGASRRASGPPRGQCGLWLNHNDDATQAYLPRRHAGVVPTRTCVPFLACLLAVYNRSYSHFPRLLHKSSDYGKPLSQQATQSNLAQWKRGKHCTICTIRDQPS